VKEATSGKIAPGARHPRAPGGQSARTQRTVLQEPSGGRFPASRPTFSTASKLPIIHFYEFNASYVIMRNKFGRVFAKYVGTHRKSPKICVWVPKSLVTNVRGPSKFGYLKTKPKLVLQGYASGGSKWIIDSGCTNHMTGERSMFSTYEENDDPTDLIFFGDNSQGRVLGVGNIAISSEHFISKVFLLKPWTTTYYPYHNFVTWATIVFLLMKV
jgi:hypothetical protein